MVRLFAGLASYKVSAYTCSSVRLGSLGSYPAGLNCVLRGANS